MAIKFNNKGSSNVKVHKPASEVIFKILFILSIIATVLMGLYAVAPVAGFMAGMVVYITGIAVALIPGACTAFLIYFSKGYRDFVGNWFNTGSKLINGSIKLKDMISEPYIIIVVICAAISIAVLIMSIILFKKKGAEDLHNEHKHKMIASITLTSLLVIFTIISAVLIFAIK